MRWLGGWTLEMMMGPWRLLLLGILLVGLPGRGHAQVTFQPEGCEFRVWFIVEPSVTTATVPAGAGTVETKIASLGVRLDDGNAHMFRAECTAVALGGMSEADLLEDMGRLVEISRLQDARVWVEREAEAGLLIGRARASIDTGERTYFLDIRRYLGGASFFDAWAGAEVFPTEGIVMFYRSIAYRDEPVHR